MVASDKKPVVFISYSHRDRRIKDRLVEHIGVLGATEFELWEDKAIQTGADWREGIDQALARADAAVLLISTDFLTSHFIKSVELPKLLGKPVYPILIGYCAWQKVPWLEKLQVRTDNGQPLGTRGRKLDRALVEVAVEMAELYGAGAGPGRELSGELATPAPAPPACQTSPIRLDPADRTAAVVLQKGPTGPVINLRCRLQNDGELPITLHRLEVQFTDPHGSSFRLKWNLFYEGTRIHLKTGDAHPITVSPKAEHLEGIQFVGPPTVIHYRWSRGKHRCEFRAWLREPIDAERPDIVSACEFVVSGEAARSLIYWSAAGGPQWAALNDPDDAIGIAVPVSRQS